MNELPLPLDGLGHYRWPSEPALSRYAAERHALLHGLPPRPRPAIRSLWSVRRLLARGLRSTARRLEPRLDAG